MRTRKDPLTNLVTIITAVCILALGPTMLYAADATITAAFDEIGQKYEINNAGDIFLTFSINNNETSVDFTVKPLGDKGDFAFIYSGDPASGVNSLICRLTAQCRGAKLSAAIDSYINAVYRFKVTQQKHSSSYNISDNAPPPPVKEKMPTNDGGVPSRMQSSSTINDTPFTINDKWMIEFGNALQLISLYENTSGRPIKAFRVTWGVLDDFGEVAFKLKTEFTGSSTYLSGEDKTQGHVIEPGEKIYYSMMIIDDIEQIGYFASQNGLKKELSMSLNDLENHRIDKKHMLEIDKIIYADQ